MESLKLKYIHNNKKSTFNKNFTALLIKTLISISFLPKKKKSRTRKLKRKARWTNERTPFLPLINVVNLIWTSRNRGFDTILGPKKMIANKKEN